MDEWARNCSAYRWETDFDFPYRNSAQNSRLLLFLSFFATNQQPLCGARN